MSIAVPYYYKTSADVDLYISHIILTIGMFPIVFLKNSSSMTSPETPLSVGNNRSNFPNLKGCPGCAAAMYLLNVS